MGGADMWGLEGEQTDGAERCEHNMNSLEGCTILKYQLDWWTKSPPTLRLYCYNLHQGTILHPEQDQSSMVKIWAGFLSTIQAGIHDPCILHASAS